MCLSSVIGAGDGSLLVSGQGLDPDSAMETLKIHEENQAKLQSMSETDILEEQNKLLAQLGDNNIPVFNL